MNDATISPQWQRHCLLGTACKPTGIDQTTTGHLEGMEAPDP